MYKLYVLNSCPFCHHVMAFIDQNNIEVEILDRNEGSNLADLFQRGGKSQVPYLFDTINDVEMYESRDIIAYLQKQQQIKSGKVTPVE